MQKTVDTRTSIVKLADTLVREKGFNAFSFYDISGAIGIKTASIHYHFPTKTDLAIAIIHDHIDQFEAYKKQQEGKSPTARLEAFFGIYTKIKSEKKICLVGSLATDLYSIDKKIAPELKVLIDAIVDWLTDILKEGKAKKVFAFKIAPRTKALMIVSNMMALVQIIRLSGEQDFQLVKEAIIKELKP